MKIEKNLCRVKLLNSAIKKKKKNDEFHFAIQLLIKLLLF